MGYDRIQKKIYLFSKLEHDFVTISSSSFRISSKSSLLSSLKQTGIIVGSDITTSGILAVASLHNLYIIDNKSEKILKEFVCKPNSKATFKPSFTTLYAMEESRSLFWWRDPRTLVIICLSSFEILHTLEIIPFFKGI